MDNYVKVFRKKMPMVMSQIPMKKIEQMLPADKFIRVHRSYIVSINSIDRYSNRGIYLSGQGEPVPVGRKYTNSIDILTNFLNNKKD